MMMNNDTTSEGIVKGIRQNVTGRQLTAAFLCGIMEAEGEVPEMMKRVCILLLALLLPVTAALSERLALDDYAIPLPEDVLVEESETMVALVRGSTRLVAQAFPQAMEEDPAAQVLTLMTVYSAQSADVQSLTMIPGVYGARGVIRNSFGEGEDQLFALILSESGLLVLSAYDLAKDNHRADRLLMEILQGTTLLSESVFVQP